MGEKRKFPSRRKEAWEGDCVRIHSLRRGNEKGKGEFETGRTLWGGK